MKPHAITVRDLGEYTLGNEEDELRTADQPWRLIGGLNFKGCTNISLNTQADTCDIYFVHVMQVR